MGSIEGFVLAGGQSRRMGRDKATMPFGDTTMIGRAAAALSIIADPVYAVGDLTAGDTTLEIIPDEPVKTDKRASIIGLYTALVNAKTDWIAVLACDLPFADGRLFSALVSVLPAETPRADGPAAIMVRQTDGRIQPLCALYRPSLCLAVVEGMLSGDNWRLQALPDLFETTIVEIGDLAGADGVTAGNWLININTPDEYRAALDIEAAQKRGNDP